VTIDERLKFLLQSAESLHATALEHSRQIEERARQMRELDERERRHDQRIRRPLKAALEAWLDEGKNDEPSR
jgi:hypothetical protein